MERKDRLFYEGSVSRRYAFSIEESRDMGCQSLPRMSYEITVQFDRCLEQREHDPRTRQRFVRVGTDLQRDPYFTLSVQNEMTFRDALAFMKRCGVPDSAKIATLLFGDTHIVNLNCHSPSTRALLLKAEGLEGIDTTMLCDAGKGSVHEQITHMPQALTIADLPQEIIHQVSNAQGYILFNLVRDGRNSAVGMEYEQRHEHDKPMLNIPSDERIRTMGYSAREIQRSLFDDVLSTAPFLLDASEKEMIERFIVMNLDRMRRGSPPRG